MGLARVWNENTYPYTEVFKEKTISIAPGAYVEMDEDEAVEFKSAFTGVKTDGERNPLPQYFKKLRIERLAKSEPVMPLICHATGKQAANEVELARMNAEHLGQLEEKSAEFLQTQARMMKEIEELKAALRDRDEQAKRGPGRPKKEG